MGFNRLINNDLINWKQSSSRKPLIIRGARQVGKTTLVKDFAKTYKQSVLLNLEKPANRRYFEDFDDVKSILEAIFLAKNLNSKDLNNTLLFLDEIQESPKAISLLRYFYEELPDLHVVAAGSLLEFAIRDVPSFPVGRVQFLYLHPLNFIEYLNAIGQHSALGQIDQVPLKEYAHGVLMDHYHRFAIIGGMPEIVQSDINKGNMADLQQVYESIWGTYKNDVEKYTNNSTDRKIIKHIMNTAPLALDQRIKFQGFGNSTYRSREVVECFRTLEDARILKLIYPTTELTMPVQPDIKRSPRIQLLDTGLANYTLGIQGQLLAMHDLSNAYRGALIPHLFTQELISKQTIVDQKPNFWVREKNQSSAEVDLVYAFQGMLLPIEVKSGSTGKLRSLHQFIDASEHDFAIRVYGGMLKIEQHKTISGKPYHLLNLPYYLGTKLDDYISWFLANA